MMTILMAAMMTMAQDAAKNEVEQPVKKMADVGKSMVELKVIRALDVRTAAAGKTSPGKVKWHASFAKACEAAGKSGKPVLLFQLLGDLDDEFC